MNYADVRVGEVYQVLPEPTPLEPLHGTADTEPLDFTFTPGSIVKVVARGSSRRNFVAELIFGKVTEIGASYEVLEDAVQVRLNENIEDGVTEDHVGMLWVLSDEIQPLDPDQHANNTPTCDSCQCSPCRAAPDTCDTVTKEPAHDP